MSGTIKSALPLLLGNMVVLFLLLAGGLFSFLSAYGLTPDSTVLLAACGIFAALFALLWSVPHGGWGALLLLGADALAAWRLRERLEPAAALLGAAVTRGAYGDRGGAEEALTAALLLLALAAAFVLGWLAVRERCWHLPAVIVITPLLSAFLSGVLPDLLPLLAQTAGWGTVLLTSLYNRKDRESLGKGVWMSLGGISALLLLLLVLLPQEGYTRPRWATNARDGLVRTVSRRFSEILDWDFGYGSGNSVSLDTGVPASGGESSGEVDLAAAGPRNYAGNVVLQIIGGHAGRVYLRGGSSGVYTGAGWKAVSQSAYENMRYTVSHELGSDGPEPALFPAMTVPEEAAAETMTVRHIRGEAGAAFFPYRLKSFPDRLAALSGDGGAVRLMQEYQAEYFPGGPVAGGFEALRGGSARAEEIYRRFVYENYLDVPEEAAQALRPLAAQSIPGFPDWQGDLPEQYRPSAVTAMCAAKTLAQEAVYDLNVPAPEPGEDFVRHFLEEGRGYCVHFATAGTLLLRMYGIPARYVEGYAAWLSDRDVSAVRDQDAHAWVEIYLDGYGWYPVEMTPGYQGDSAASAAEEILQTDKPAQPEPEESEEPEQPENGETSERPSEENPADSETDEPEAKNRDLSWVWKTAAALLALAAPCGAYRLAELLRRKKRENPDNNQSVIYAYLRYQKLRRWGGPEEAELEELGRKAKFSQHTLTGEERDAAWRCVGHAAEEVRKNLKWWKRAAFLAAFGGLDRLSVRKV